MARIAGWNVVGASAAGAAVQAKKAAASGKQHIIDVLDVSFSSAPGAAVLVSIVNPDVSPNTVYFTKYLTGINPPPITFPSGLAITPGAGAEVQLASAGGAIIGRVNLAGFTQ